MTLGGFLVLSSLPGGLGDHRLAEKLPEFRLGEIFAQFPKFHFGRWSVLVDQDAKLSVVYPERLGRFDLNPPALNQRVFKIYLHRFLPFG
jgi:hypothetical protein